MPTLGKHHCLRHRHAEAHSCGVSLSKDRRKASPKVIPKAKVPAVRNNDSHRHADLQQPNLSEDAAIQAALAASTREKTAEHSATGDSVVDEDLELAMAISASLADNKVPRQRTGDTCCVA